jgi:hypothetical protein
MTEQKEYLVPPKTKVLLGMIKQQFIPGNRKIIRLLTLFSRNKSDPFFSPYPGPTLLKMVGSFLGFTGIWFSQDFIKWRKTLFYAQHGIADDSRKNLWAGS